jgi:hypothetical protein
MGEERNEDIVLVGKLKERDHFENLGTDGTVILKLILRK